MNLSYLFSSRSRVFLCKLLTPAFKTHKVSKCSYVSLSLKNVTTFPSKQSSCSRNIRLLHDDPKLHFKNKSTLMYVTAVGLLVVGFSYAAVPLYRIFCQSTGYGGEVRKGHGGEVIETMKKVKHRPIHIHFNADTSSTMEWKFKPHQHEIVVVPGETALAFYTATNPTNTPIVGISTYNVIPFEAGQYFNKIQVDMPVFFYIDPEFAEDPRMENVNEITLSYTFFEAKEGINLPIPSYARI